MNFIKVIIFSLSIGFSTIISAKSFSNQIESFDQNIVVDFSAAINKQIQNENICNTDYKPTKFNKKGVAIKMLGFAYVYFGAGPGMSKFGHSGERIVYCKGNQLYDILYDGMKFDKNLISYFQKKHPKAPKAYINSEKVFDSLYYRKIQNPTKLSHYGLEITITNRNIYEQWLSLTEKEIYDLLLVNINRMKAQKELIQQRKKLPRFSGLFNNCTYQVTEDLQVVPSLIDAQIDYKVKRLGGRVKMTKQKSLTKTLHSVHPKSVFFSLSKGNITDLLVIYPSQESMREIYFQKLTFEEIIDYLEVPEFNINPQGSEDWSIQEASQIRRDFKDYESPLSEYFKSII